MVVLLMNSNVLSRESLAYALHHPAARAIRAYLLK
jgi:hypothetical protein